LYANINKYLIDFFVLLTNSDFLKPRNKKIGKSEWNGDKPPLHLKNENNKGDMWNISDDYRGLKRINDEACGVVCSFQIPVSERECLER
jgi:hypothetical protein